MDLSLLSYALLRPDDVRRGVVSYSTGFKNFLQESKMQETKAHVVAAPAE